jgi:hypothetical protein
MATYGLAEFQADIEGDIAWRQQEVRSIKRALSSAQNDQDKSALRRALITLLYAHLEGGFKVAVCAYIRTINQQGLKVATCNPHIAASAWASIFRDLANPSKKSDWFRNALPDDTKLHAFARHAEFVARVRESEDISVEIEDAKVVDTEGNIDQVVISKILFRLGFPPNAFEKRYPDLQYLRKLRNPIAHGEREVATETHCAKYEEAVFGVLTRLRDLLTKAISERQCLRRVS